MIYEHAFEASYKSLLHILREDAFAKRAVKLSSGKESDFYINCKRALTPNGLIHIGDLFYETIRRRFPRITDQPVGVGGLTMGADPLTVATAIAARRNAMLLTPFFVRKEPKKHGTEDFLEGPELPEGARVVIVEDVITTGASTIKAIERARLRKLVPVFALALVDRLEENGRQNIEAVGVPVHALYTRLDFPT